jgi:hypothetical protein
MLTDRINPDDDSLKAGTPQIQERSTQRLKRFCALIETAAARDAARLSEQALKKFPWPLFHQMPMTYSPCCPSWAPSRFILMLWRPQEPSATRRKTPWRPLTVDAVVGEVLAWCARCNMRAKFGVEPNAADAQRLVALEILLALVDEDMEAIEWFRKLVLNLPEYPDLRKLRLHVVEDSEAWRMRDRLAEIIWGSKWRDAAIGKEFAYLKKAVWYLTKKLRNMVEGEHIAACKAGYRLESVDELPRMEEVEEVPQIAGEVHWELLGRYTRASVAELKAACNEDDDLRQYIDLKVKGWKARAAWERLGWEERRGLAIDRKFRRLLGKLKSSGFEHQGRDIELSPGVSDANCTVVKERLRFAVHPTMEGTLAGRQSWEHRWLLQVNENEEEINPLQNVQNVKKQRRTN